MGRATEAYSYITEEDTLEEYSFITITDHLKYLRRDNRRGLRKEL